MDTEQILARSRKFKADVDSAGIDIWHILPFGHAVGKIPIYFWSVVIFFIR